MASAAEDRKGSGTYGGREVIALFDLDGTLTEPRQ
ncbi:phosphomannomutase, partial [Toxoplasma gondii ARI]